MTITFSKIQTGEFSVLLDGQTTPYRILNGSMGLSGQGSNHYGIINDSTGKTQWLGSLQKCKKSVTYWITGK